MAERQRQSEDQRRARGGQPGGLPEVTPLAYPPAQPDASHGQRQPAYDQKASRGSTSFGQSWRGPGRGVKRGPPDRPTETNVSVRESPLRAKVVQLDGVFAVAETRLEGHDHGGTIGIILIDMAITVIDPTPSWPGHGQRGALWIDCLAVGGGDDGRGGRAYGPSWRWNGADKLGMGESKRDQGQDQDQRESARAENRRA